MEANWFPAEENNRYWEVDGEKGFIKSSHSRTSELFQSAAAGASLERIEPNRVIIIYEFSLRMGVQNPLCWLTVFVPRPLPFV